MPGIFACAEKGKRQEVSVCRIYAAVFCYRFFSSHGEADYGLHWRGGLLAYVLAFADGGCDSIYGGAGSCTGRREGEEVSAFGGNASDNRTDRD